MKKTIKKTRGGHAETPREPKIMHMVKRMPKAIGLMAALGLWMFFCAQVRANTIEFIPAGGTFSNSFTLTVACGFSSNLSTAGCGLSDGNGNVLNYLAISSVPATDGTTGGWIYQTYAITGGGTYTALTAVQVPGSVYAQSNSAAFYFVVNELVTTPSQIFNSPLTAAANSAYGISEYPPLVVYYTTDGSLPTTNSTQSSTAPISSTTTIIWMGTRAGYSPQYVTNTYTYVAPLTASPAPGLYNNAVNITLTAPGSGINYSLDGTNWNGYTGPIHVDGYGSGSLTLQAYYSGSATNQFVYTFQANAPQVAPPSTNFTGSITITASGDSGSTITYDVSDQNGNPLQYGVAYTNSIVNTGSYSYTFQEQKTGYSPSTYVVVSYTTLPQTVLMVTNLSALTIYNNAQMGTPWWQIHAGNDPNNLSAVITYADTLPGHTAAISLTGGAYLYYSYAISTNGGTNLLLVPLTLIGSSGSQNTWTAVYNGQGNTETTSTQNPGVTQILTAANTGTVQTAQNPGQSWLFQENPLMADPLTAQVLNGSLWLNSNQDYLVSIQGPVSGTYDMVAELRELPFNDYFSNAIVWQPTTSSNLPLSVVTNGYNIYATAENGEQMVMGGQTVWYQIYPSQGGTFTAEVDPYYSERFNIQANLKPFNFNLFNPEMTLWQGTNLAGLALLADSKVPNPTTSVNPYNFPDKVSCAMNPSNTYYFRIDASASPGEYTLTKTFVPLANNDNFANAQLLLSDATVYDNGTRYQYGISSANYGAGTEPGEPLQDTASVWYEIITPSAGYMASTAVSTIPGSNVVVYQYTIPANEAVTVSNVVANPQRTFFAAGTAVYLAVCGSQTTFNLNATLTIPPANDYTTNALILSGDADNSTLFYVYDSYSKADEALDVQIPGALNSIWWTVTPEAAGTLTVQNTDGTYPNTYWVLFENGQQVPVMDMMADRRTYQLNDVSNYLFKLTEPNANEGDGHLNFTLSPNPTNYQGNPTPIVAYTMETYADGLVYDYSIDGTDNATNQPGDPFNHTVWYSWIPPLPDSGLAAVSVTSPNVNYQVTLDGNNQVTNPIACTPTDNLLVAVGGNIDTYTLGIDFREPPSNDELANAIPATLGQNYLFYTTYGTMSTNVFGASAVEGAADLWCTYDPASEENGSQTNVSFYISLVTNGPQITIQVIQDNQVIGQASSSLLNNPPLNITLSNTDLVVLRLIVAQPNTDFTLSIQSQSLNETFASAAVINLVPTLQTVAVAGGSVNLTKYTSHIVANNLNSFLEAGEPFSGFETRDPGNLAGRILWWQVTTPVEGIFSIKTSPASDLLDIEITRGNTLPHSIFDFIAWNATTMSQNNTPSDGTVVFGSSPGQTYWIRIDTLAGGTGRVEFDISQISYPAGDDVMNPAPLTQTGGQQAGYYLGVYPTQTGGASYSGLGTIYGATREYINGNLERASEDYLISTRSAQQWGLGQLPLYPAWQTLWFKFTPATTANYVIQNSASFEPIILMTQNDPILQQPGYQYINNNAQMTLQQGQTYYFTIDALVPPADTFSGNAALFALTGNAQLCDEPVDVGLQGLNTDINRDCEDSIAGVISLNLVPSSLPPNDSILNPIPLTLGQGYVQDSCTDPYGDYLVRYAEENTNATSETNALYVTADYMGGAGKTLWWTVSAAITGPLFIDTLASQMPVIVKVFAGSLDDPAYLFSNGQAELQATAGVNYLVGMDSAPGTSGMMAFTIYQNPTSPLNDNFANAREITTPQVCGSLNYSTIQQYESVAATGSIWYKIKNYTGTNQVYAFQLVATNALMDLFENSGERILNCLPEALSQTNIAYVAQAGEEDYIRIWTSNSPPSGLITINTTLEPSWYTGEEYITPSGSFQGSMTIQALSQSSAPPLVYYSAGGTTTNSTFYSGPFIITNSQSIDFLVEIQNVTSYHITNIYNRLPDVYITPSCIFSNQMQVNVGSVSSGNTVAYMQGAADGTPPQMQNWLLFPETGLVITNSAEVDIMVSGNGSYTIAQQHYTNTVAAPQITPNGACILVSSTTAGASLQIQQGSLVVNCPTNATNVLATTPQVEATASLSGWIPSATYYGFSAVLTNYASIQIVTNNQTPSELDVTLVNPNDSSTVIWYTIQHASTNVISTSSTTNVSLALDYTCTLTTYAGTPQLSSVGPTNKLQFTATLAMPLMTGGNNQLTIVNPNTNITSALYVNGIDIGNVGQYILNSIQVGVMDTAYALSGWASPSPTNEFIPQFTLSLLVSPPGTNFNTDLPVTITTGQGSLNVTISEAGLPPVTYPNAANPNIGNTFQTTLDRSATIVASVQLYGIANSAQTNVYQAQVGPVQCTMPGYIDNNQTYDSQTPVILNCVTTNVTYEYNIGGGWIQLPDNQLHLQNGTYTYQIMATRAGWAPSPILSASWTAGANASALVNYVAQYYTLFPGSQGNPPNPVTITATNYALVNNPPYSYQNFVYMAGTTPSDQLSIDATNTYAIYHYVEQDFETSPGVFVATYGPTNLTYVTVVMFDWSVVPTPGSTNDLDLVVSSDTNISDNVFFYKPTWIQAWTNLPLQAVVTNNQGMVTAYMDLTPLQNPTNATMYLIPGNLYGDCINLQYWVPSGNSFNTNYFTMLFRTLPPAQYRSSSNNNTVVVLISPDYSYQDVGVYYTSNSADAQNAPFSGRVSMTNLNGTEGNVPLNYVNSSGSNNWMINSQYHMTPASLTNYLTNLTNGTPPLPIYGPQ